MERLTNHLVVRCASHFTVGVRFEFKTIDLSEFEETMQECAYYFRRIVEKFKTTCESNGFIHVEIYEQNTVTFSEDCVGMWASGDCHEPITESLLKELGEFVIAKQVASD